MIKDDEKVKGKTKMKTFRAMFDLNEEEFEAKDLEEAERICLDNLSIIEVEEEEEI